MGMKASDAFLIGIFVGVLIMTIGLHLEGVI